MKKILFLFALVLPVIARQHEPVNAPLMLDQPADKWRADIKFFRDHYPLVHVNPFHALSRERFNAELDSLSSDVPNLSDEQILVRFMRLIAEVRDGHCSLADDTLMAGGVLPLRFGIYPDGVLIQSGVKEYEGIIGGRVIKIGNTPIAEALKLIDTVAWGDRGNEMSRKDTGSWLFGLARVLKGLAIVDRTDKVPLTVDVGGREVVAEVAVVTDARAFFRNAVRVYANRNASNPLPLYLKEPENFYRFEFLPESKTMYAQFNVTQNKQGGESIAQFSRRLSAAVEENHAEKLVLDLRLNTGGNGFFNKPLILALIKSRLNERGKLFVVIGRRTYSAAQNLVNELEKYTSAIFVGEPTGSSPNMYGDPATIVLPNSHIGFRIPTRWHQQAELGAQDSRIWTEPEIYTEPTAADYLANIDPAMNAILNYRPGTAFRDLVTHFTANFALADFEKAYRDFKAAPRNRFVNTEADTNRLGYSLLNAKRFDDAIAVFKMNTTAYPRSANTFDSLGEAYLLAGNKDEAIRSYEQALKIDPNFGSALEALRRLRGN
jgi:tetratricopeptide (TPR) repeat protein